MKTKLSSAVFEFNTGTVKFTSAKNSPKYEVVILNEKGECIGKTTTDSVTIAMAKDLLDEADVRASHPPHA